MNKQKIKEISESLDRMGYFGEDILNYVVRIFRESRQEATASFRRMLDDLHIVEISGSGSYRSVKFVGVNDEMDIMKFKSVVGEENWKEWKKWNVGWYVVEWREILQKLEELRSKLEEK